MMDVGGYMVDYYVNINKVVIILMLVVVYNNNMMWSIMMIIKSNLIS